MNNKEKINELISNLKEPITELKRLQKIKLDMTKEKVKYIIKNKVRNEYEIEHVFDDLIDLTYWYGEEINELFYELLIYFRTLNINSSDEYEKDYSKIIKEIK